MFNLHSIKKVFVLAIGLATFSGCVTYYSLNYKLMSSYEQKDFTKAEDILNQKKWEKKKRNLLLYYLNKGSVLHMLGKFKESNEYFQKADYFIEDYHKNYALEALTYVTNPSLQQYSGENFEKILLHYYSTLNYLQLNQPDEALIECKRMLIVMDNIGTYYKSNNKYKRDAFTHLLLGIIYDSQKNYQDAFIAYRNAYEVYRDDYKKLLGTEIPLQLKKDLLRTAYLTGSFGDLDEYEKEFGFKYDKSQKNQSSLVCFWNNGLGPIKAQNNIDFIITNLGNGYVEFTNVELGMNIPFFVGDDKTKTEKLAALQVIRVSFPKFVSRPLKYGNAYIKTGSDSTQLEIAEDVNAIAFRSLHDRMVKEVGEALLRLALKKVAEMELSKENQGAGTALNLVNALSEQADTRNWQMLPYSINYTRVSLNEGKNDLVLKTFDFNSNCFRDSISITADTKPKTYFHYSTTF